MKRSGLFLQKILTFYLCGAIFFAGGIGQSLIWGVEQGSAPAVPVASEAIAAETTPPTEAEVTERITEYFPFGRITEPEVAEAGVTEGPIVAEEALPAEETPSTALVVHVYKPNHSWSTLEWSSYRPGDSFIQHAPPKTEPKGEHVAYPDVNVAFIQNAEVVVHFTTDTNGEYALHDLPAGDYTVVAENEAAKLSGAIDLSVEYDADGNAEIYLSFVDPQLPVEEQQPVPPQQQQSASRQGGLGALAGVAGLVAGIVALAVKSKPEPVPVSPFVPIVR